MNYRQTIDYLYSRLPMFTRIGAAAYKKDLHNTYALLQALGNPHHRFKSIHLAGTNGKGSSSHMLAAILHCAGYKVGLYTSPHLYDFRERIKVSSGAMLEVVPEAYVVDITRQLMPTIEAVEPSFFEVTVAMAFAYFADQVVDVAVVETGLGGRLDSTNVVLPELSIITNIGWDHMALLGNTLPAIAGEKAGIIKPGVPVVVGEILPETEPVFRQKAQLENAPLHLAQDAWQVSIAQSGIEALELTCTPLQGSTPTLTLSTDLPGQYQQYNVRTVLTAVQQLQQQGWQIATVHIAEGLASAGRTTGLWGRWQVVHWQPYVVLDVAHNEPGMQQLLQQVGRLQAAYGFGCIYMVLGMVRDKDVQKVLSMLPRQWQYFFTQATQPRALPYTELAIQAQSMGLQGHGYPIPQQALEAALGAATSNDLIIVCGSVFVVAEISLSPGPNPGLSLPQVPPPLST